MLNLKQAIFMISLLLLSVTTVSAVNPALVSAETITCPSGKTFEQAESDTMPEAERCALLDKNATQGNLQGDCNADNLDKTNCGILAYLLKGINLLSGLVGIVVVIMIAIGGIQYSASRDSPQAAAAAKDKIRNAILALVGYLFIYMFLQYIVPGGIL